MESDLPLEVSLDRARRLLDFGALLLDVRSRAEREVARIGGSVWIPIEEVASRWRELPLGRPIVVYCSAGTRSFRTTKFLREQALPATSLVGGMTEWMAQHLALEVGKEAPLA